MTVVDPPSPLIVPVRIPISANTDANGAATMHTLPSASLWSLVTISVTAVDNPGIGGAPTWVAFANGLQIGSVQGITANIGPVLLAPNEELQITVVGAKPATQVSGGYSGSACADSSLLLGASLGASGTTPYQSVVANQVPMASFLVPSGGIKALTALPIPKGCQVLALYTVGSFFTVPPLVVVTGHQSGIVFYNNSLSASPQFVFVSGAYDTSVDVSINDVFGNPPTTYLLAGVLQGGLTAVASYQAALATRQQSPPTGTILSGSYTGGNIASSIIVTIGAASTWYGTVGVSLLAAAFAGGSAMRVSVAGVGTTPAPGTVLCEADIGAGGGQASNSTPGVYVRAGTSGCNLVVAVNGGGTFGSAVCHGLLL